MKGFLIATAFGLGLLGASISTAGTALASGEDDHRTYGGYKVYKHLGALLYGSPSRHGYRQDRRRGYSQDRRHGYSQDRRHDYRPAKRHHHRKRYTSYPKRRAYGQRHKSYQTARPCHATSKAGFDDYGRRVRIGGTMCYNAYGTPYIVRGSRHIIHNY